MPDGDTCRGNEGKQMRVRDFSKFATLKLRCVAGRLKYAIANLYMERRRWRRSQ